MNCTSKIIYLKYIQVASWLFLGTGAAAAVLVELQHHISLLSVDFKMLLLFQLNEKVPGPRGSQLGALE